MIAESPKYFWFSTVRRRTRRLVVVVYWTFVLGLFGVYQWALVYRAGHFGSNDLLLPLYVVIFLPAYLGGVRAGGIVKPFNGVHWVPLPDRHQTQTLFGSSRPLLGKQYEQPPSLLALKLRVYQPVPAGDDSVWRSDERELHQRDHAHYLAFQAVGVVICVPMLIASMRLIRPSLMSWIPMPPDAMYYGLTLVTIILFLTLPQAILLWTEPDMEDVQP